ncbi:MAG: PepSY-like domain-containing protein [Bacteroidales bacterium]|nr:PepSY-like domain-containing protein [Bacteroidales bacterium]
MKSFLRIFVALAAMLTSSTLVSCKDVIITPDKLPAAAQSFIKEYFPETAISYAKKDVELTKTSYEVTLQDGTEIDFDSKGEWDKVDCKRAAVPASLVPAVIAEYVETSFPGQVIVKIDKERYGYEIELASDLELKFDKNGKLLSIDD